MPSEVASGSQTPRTAPTGSADPRPAKRTVVVHIRPSPKWRSLALGELWQYRELLYFLTWRDLKVRYAHTALGAAWAIIVPVLSMLIFTLFFGKLGGFENETSGFPYTVF